MAGGLIYIDVDGKAIPVGTDTPLPVTGGGGGGGGTGDASAAKQDAQTALLTTIRDDQQTGNASLATAAAQGSGNALLTSIRDDQIAGNSLLTAIRDGSVIGTRRDADTGAAVDGQTHPLFTNTQGRLKVATVPGDIEPVTGDITTATSVVQANVGRASNVVVHVTGTFTGVNFTFEGSLNGTNWFGVQAARTTSNNVDTTSGVLGAAPAYAWELSVNGLSQFRVRATARTSGTAVVHIQPGVYATEPIPVLQTHPVTQSGVWTLNTVPGSGTGYTLVSAASTNAALITGGVRNLSEITVFNPTAAAVYVKLYNKVTAPTVGTDVPVVTIPVATNGLAAFNFGTMGKRFNIGLGIAITAGPLATDTVAVAAGVQVSATHN